MIKGDGVIIYGSAAAASPDQENSQRPRSMPSRSPWEMKKGELVETLMSMDVPFTTESTAAELRQLVVNHRKEVKTANKLKGLGDLKLAELRDKCREMELTIRSGATRGEMMLAIREATAPESGEEVTFGRYKGQRLMDVLKDYLDWAVAESEANPSHHPELGRMVRWYRGTLAVYCQRVVFDVFTQRPGEGRRRGSSQAGAQVQGILEGDRTPNTEEVVENLEVLGHQQRLQLGELSRGAAHDGGDHRGAGGEAGDPEGGQGSGGQASGQPLISKRKMKKRDYWDRRDHTMRVRRDRNKAEADHFIEGWVSWAGPPTMSTVDQQRGFTNEFAGCLEKIGTVVRYTGGQAHCQQGHIERQGQWFRPVWDKVVEHKTTLAEDVDYALAECASAKNWLRRVHGFSPSQWLFGGDPGIGDAMIDENAELHLAEELKNPNEEWRRRHQIRCEAREAFIKSQADASVKRALLARPRKDLRAGRLRLRLHIG